MSEVTPVEPRFVSLFGMYIVGWEVRTTNRDEIDPARAKIPGLWKRAIEEELAGQIAEAKERGVMVCAYTRYLSDDQGPYSAIVGVEVPDLENVPKGMTGITVLAQEYVVFPVDGEIPQAVVGGWSAVWKYFSRTTELSRAFTTDFERYDATTPNAVEIFVAIR